MLNVYTYIAAMYEVNALNTYNLNFAASEALDLHLIGTYRTKDLTCNKSYN